MLSLRKKSETAAPQSVAWHTNFRNFERLPDTKAVRTTFFINGVAVLAAVAAVLFFGLQEFNRRTLAQQIARWEEQIAAERAASTAAVTAYQKFQDEERKVNEVAAFTRRQLVPSEFVLRLGETLPPEIVLTHIEYRTAAVTLRGSVRGAPNEASGTAQAYAAQLEADPVFGRHFESVRLTSLARDGVTGELNFEALLKFPEPKAEKASRRKKR